MNVTFYSHPFLDSFPRPYLKILFLVSSIFAKYIKFSNELQFNPIHVIYPLIIVYAKWNYINQSKNFSTRSTLFIRLFISF